MSANEQRKVRISAPQAYSLNLRSLSGVKGCNPPIVNINDPHAQVKKVPSNNVIDTAVRLAQPDDHVEVHTQGDTFDQAEA